MDAPTLAEAMGCKLALAQAYVDDVNRALLAARATTVRRAAMYCAQVGHESAGLRYMEEIATGQAYEGRRDLGNTVAGDGRRYKGRGPIQLTGRHNYGLFSRWAHDLGLVNSPTFFVDSPGLVATSRWGFLAASWYWTVARPRINALSDDADLVAVTRAINGGTNGLADRKARWERCLRLGDRLLPTAAVADVRTATTAARTAAAPPVRRDRGDDMHTWTDEPPAGAPKWEWPTRRIPFAFDPAGGWGGDALLKIDHGGRGGWIHLLRWWVRAKDWTPERPVHYPVDVPIGPTAGRAGSERFVGYGWQAAPPPGADQLEIVVSAPDGVHVQSVYEK